MDPMLLIMVAVLAVLMFFMMRRNKKTQAQQQEMQSKFAPGVEVMTNYGLFGTIVSMDEAENKVVLELSPGNTATVHRQSLVKVVEPVVPDTAESLLAENATAEAAPASEAPVASAESAAPAGETPEETLKRLNGESESK